MNGLDGKEWALQQRRCRANGKGLTRVSRLADHLQREKRIVLIHVLTGSS
ncbi:MAG: hypothetical protein V3S39_04300 [Thermodesulfobacteriota bacterium]